MGKGEAEAKRVAMNARVSLAGMRKSMLVEISERVEEMGDNLFAMIQGNHQKLADNYLSLKAYAVVSRGALKDYVTKGKGKDLSSVKVNKAEGVGFGTQHLPAIFTGKGIALKD